VSLLLAAGARRCMWELHSERYLDATKLFMHAENLSGRGCSHAEGASV
jgi:hypothetical protein